MPLVLLEQGCFNTGIMLIRRSSNVLSFDGTIPLLVTAREISQLKQLGTSDTFTDNRVAMAIERWCPIVYMYVHVDYLQLLAAITGQVFVQLLNF